MQQVSEKYEQSIKMPLRNRGYIKVSIGVLNSEAQKNAVVEQKESPVTYFSDTQKPFDGYKVNKVYATAEEDFSHVDGTMYFLPEKDTGYVFYNSGIVSNGLLGKIYISLGGITGLDIKGLTIDFGEYYPTSFTIENDYGVRSYINNKSLFITEDVFGETSFFVITPVSMVNGNGRMRIHEMNFGIANTFSNEKVLNCNMKEFVSPISETIPSMDVTLKIDNQDLYYSVDNPESAIAYMEVGQEVKVAFGYDITGDGDIEWLAETTTYLSSWSANDVEATFTSTDKFYQLGEMFYGGLYRENGISLYDLAEEVLKSAGIEDERDYYIDTYLKKIAVYNPVPVVTHAEALQIIANAGRCILREDRNNKIHLKSSFVPDMYAEVNNMAGYSSIKNLLKDNKKSGYAVASKDFSVADGSLFFMPENTDYKETGYVSGSTWIEPEKGTFVRRLGFRLGTDEKHESANAFWDGEQPKITIKLESTFDAFGILINFRNVAPKEFVIKTYRESVLIDTVNVENPGIQYITEKRFIQFDRMEIEFIRGYPNSRVFVDNILIGDVTNYRLSRISDLEGNPTGILQEKIKAISIKKTNYRESKEGFKELLTEELTLSQDSEHTVYFTYPSYGFKAEAKDNDNIMVSVLDSSNYYARLSISGLVKETEIKLSVSGYEYITDETYTKVMHNQRGQEISWSNPLVSETEHAMDLEKWISEYYLGDVDYQISWRGDPRVEANDLFYLQLKEREDALIRAYENELDFSGAWTGKMNARKVVMSWR